MNRSTLGEISSCRQIILSGTSVVGSWTEIRELTRSLHAKRLAVGVGISPAQLRDKVQNSV